MLCHDSENILVDYHEGLLLPERARELELHLANCAECRDFSEELRRLDATLSGTIKAPALSEDFAQRLNRRIQLASPLTDLAIAERKRQLQAEFESGVAQLGRGSWLLGSLLECLAWPTLITASAGLAWWLTARFSPSTLAGINAKLLVAAMGSAVFAAIGLAQAFPRRWTALRFS